MTPEAALQNVLHFFCLLFPPCDGWTALVVRSIPNLGGAVVILVKKETEVNCSWPHTERVELPMAAAAIRTLSLEREGNCSHNQVRGRDQWHEKVLSAAGDHIEPAKDAAVTRQQRKESC